MGSCRNSCRGHFGLLWWQDACNGEYYYRTKSGSIVRVSRMDAECGRMLQAKQQWRLVFQAQRDPNDLTYEEVTSTLPRCHCSAFRKSQYIRCERGATEWEPVAIELKGKWCPLWYRRKGLWWMYIEEKVKTVALSLLDGECAQLLTTTVNLPIIQHALHLIAFPPSQHEREAVPEEGNPFASSLPCSF